ncbi:MAG: hypothetical protein IJB25_04650 [Clostridia bacterium]|nr:hypothetical protein [Clostridia bacterium]MBQ4619152.1 hypothetical protein [Clostridia bacterium]MBQ9855199.1 hypothetical protein [Clostridia bacterium]
MKKNMILIAALIFLMLLMTACTGNDPLTPSPTVPSATIPSDNNAGSPATTSVPQATAPAATSTPESGAPVE